MADRRNGHSRSLFSEDDLVQTARAVRDEVLGVLEARLKELEADVLLRASVGLEKEFGGRIETLAARLEDRLRAVGDRCELHVNALRDAYETGLAQVKKLLDVLSDPHPVVVHVPEQPTPSVQVNVPSQPAPVVHVAAAEVHMPEAPAPVVHVSSSPAVVQVSARPPDIQVHLPEQTAPVVQLTAPPPQVILPEQPAPIVHVEAPKARKVKKTIIYDQYNRPVEITEEELGEFTSQQESEI